jgi:hypothetical protein
MDRFSRVSAGRLPVGLSCLTTAGTCPETNGRPAAHSGINPKKTHSSTARIAIIFKRNLSVLVYADIQQLEKRLNISQLCAIRKIANIRPSWHKMGRRPKKGQIGRMG